MVTQNGDILMDIQKGSHRNWVEESFGIESRERDGRWSGSIAVGSKGADLAPLKKQVWTS
jgi:hypothetical protein